MLRNRNLIFGVALLVPILFLAGWFVSATPNKCDLYQNLGHLELAKGTLAPSRERLASAEGWFSAALRAGCPSAPSTFGLGEAYAQLRRPSQAISELESNSERADFRTFLTGRLYEAMGRPDDARREYQKLPRDAAAHFYALGNLADKAGDFQGALYYYSISAMVNPAGAKAYYAAAFVYWRRLGDEDKAAEMIRQGLALDRTPSGRRDFYTGLLCYHEGKLGCARAAWTVAARSPSNEDGGADPRYLAYEMLGRTLVASRAPAGPGNALVIR